MAIQGVFRDWQYNFPAGGFTSWQQLNTIDNTDDIDASGVAVYNLVGWFDIYASQQPMMYGNLASAPQKMMIGPWTHSGGYGGQIHLAEFHRWYDYWLKGIDNGIMDEAPTVSIYRDSLHASSIELPHLASE